MEQVYRDMCHACDSKLATHHISQPGSEPPSLSLCGNCAETHVPSFGDGSPETATEACCCYCGGAATNGPISPAGMPGEGRDSRFICQPCSAEVGKLFLARLAERGLGFQDLGELVRIESFGKIFEELDGAMRRWVILRDN